MTSTRVLGGLGALGVLGLLAFVGALLHWDWLIVLGLAGMLGLLGVVVLNTNTLVRSHRLAWDKSVRLGGGAAGPVLATGPVGAPASEKDLTGALRLLQAQYVGRLDRAQTTLERAAARLDGVAGATTGAPPGDATTAGPADPIAALPDGSTLTLYAVTDGALDLAARAIARGLPVLVVDPDSADRERLSAAGLTDVMVVPADAPVAGRVLISLPTPGER